REPRYVAAATAAAEFLWSSVRDGPKLLHGWAAGRAGHGAYLDDHALLGSALVDLYEASGDRVHLSRAIELVAALGARFHAAGGGGEARFDDDGGGGYFFTAHDEERLIARTKPGADGSVPSGNGVAAHLLLRLHHLTGEPRYRERAEGILRAFHHQAAENPFAYTTYLQ